jgi:hypothetical protein
LLKLHRLSANIGTRHLSDQSVAFSKGNKYGKRKSHIGRRFSQQTVMLVIIHLDDSKEQLPDSFYQSRDSIYLLADILSHLANSS